MSQTELLEKLALFFYFALLDEAKAQSATVQAIRKIKMEFATRKIREDEFTATDFVFITNKLLDQFKNSIKPTTLAYSSSYIVLPERSNWGPWFELRKNLNEKEFRSLLYSKILKFSDSEIAAGLSLPVGTVRYRIGRALKMLGSFNLSSVSGVMDV